MKIYLDKDKRITAYEVTFYNPKGEKPITDFDSGKEESSVFLTHEQNAFIQDYLHKGGKVTDLIFDGKFIENKENLPPQVCGFNVQKTILVDILKFNSNYEINRHLKDIEKYTFKELKSIPLEQIKTEYLYHADELVLKKVNKGNFTRGKDRRYFGLFDNSDLVAFIFIINSHSLPRLAVLYHNEIYNDGGYFILFNLIKLFKEEKIKYFDLGGLTIDESGINQFKRKWGKEILASQIGNL